MNDRETTERIGRNIRHARMSRGLTMKEVGTRAGIKLSTLGRIEQGDRDVSAPAILRLAAALDVSPMALLGEGTALDPEPAAALVEQLPDDAAELKRRLIAALRVMRTPSG